MKFDFSTDTATIALFDPELLRRKLREPADWWTVPEDLLKEINANNIVVVGLGQDGLYNIEISALNDPLSSYAFQALLNCRSGLIYVGPGEDISGAELEPDESLDGGFVTAEPGLYIIRAHRAGNRITISLSLSNDRDSHNNFQAEPAL